MEVSPGLTASFPAYPKLREWPAIATIQVVSEIMGTPARTPRSTTAVVGEEFVFLQLVMCLHPAKILVLGSQMRAVCKGLRLTPAYHGRILVLAL